MKSVICFIDDDPNEVEVFKTVFSDDFRVFANSRPKLVFDELKASRNRPNLFVLDLYFPKGRDSTVDERKQMVRLQQKVEQAHKQLSDYLAQIGQDRQGGINLIPQIREKYPTVPIVFYTRKGTLDDVDICRDAGASWVAKKPQPESLDLSKDMNKQLEQAARNHKGALAARFESLASSKGWFRRVGKILKFLWDNWGKF